MKRRIAALLIASAFLSQVQEITHAAVKAGNSCPKLNTTITSGVFKYTCIKSGKKLVWGKAVKIVKPTPTPAPAPTPTPTPTPSKPLSFDNLDPFEVSRTASQSVISALNSKEQKTLNAIFTIDPLVPKLWMDQEKLRLNRIYSLLIEDFNPDSVRALYWLDTNAESIKWAQESYDSWGVYIKKNLKDDVGQPVCGNASGVAWVENINGKSVDRWGYVTCSGETTQDKGFKAVHEYFHLFQTNYRLTGEHQVQWLVEGSADYYGQILGLYLESPSTLPIHRKMLSNSVPGITTFSQQDFVKRMKDLESPLYDNRQAYYLGSLATEVLVALFGHRKVIDFMKDWQDLPDCRKGCNAVSNNLDQRFQKWFGISTDQFYEKLYPYVKAVTLEYRK